MKKTITELESWLDISNDFRPVDSIYVPVYGNQSEYLLINNPRPNIKNHDPSYLNSSLGELPEMAKGPHGLVYSDCLQLEALKHSITLVDNIVRKHNIVNQKATMHTYLLAAAIQSSLEKKNNLSKINFLEIGTYDGVNSLIMSLISDQVVVHTFDPEPHESATSWKYHKSSDQDYKSWGESHFKKRQSNILRPNIKYYPISSSCLLTRIESIQKPDIVWIDGDHRFPQIAIDLAAVLAMHRDSIILIDDVYLARSNNPTVETIRFLARDLNLDVFLHQKKPNLGKFVAIIGDNIPSELVSQSQNPILIKYSQ